MIYIERFLKNIYTYGDILNDILFFKILRRLSDYEILTTL